MMQVGAVIRQAWAMYRAHWRHFLTIAFVVFALIALLTVLLVVLLGWLGAIAAGFINLAGVYWLQGALVIAIEDVRDGRADLSIRETLDRMRQRINTLSIAALLVLVALFVAGIAIFFGFVALIVPGILLLALFIWLVVRWILMIPVIMLEGHGVFASLGRSAQLVKGNWWPMFGVLVITVLVVIGIGLVVSALLYPLPDWAQSFLGRFLASALTAPFAALAWTLSYYELRSLKDAAAMPALPAEQTSG
jgi:Membrane domain of glycerophosphoryl diester phosphodiesterase